MSPAPQPIDCEQIHPTLVVRDVGDAVAFYTTKLGFWKSFSEGAPPHFAGVNLGNVQMFLEQGAPSPMGLSVYFVVGDADQLCELHRGNGVEIVSAPEDQPYGLRDYRVRDLDGYLLGFGHRIGPLIDGPPLEIERVDFPVRLEKRLAALLHDLALYKRMSLSGTLEEILLHTNEPLGDGVASPHTRMDLRHIQELKRKHGIDYDSHASYRFVERGAKPTEELRREK